MLFHTVVVVHVTVGVYILIAVSQYIAWLAHYICLRFGGSIGLLGNYNSTS